MSRDPLAALLRLRRTSVDDAQKSVAEAYRAEQIAIEAVREATDTLEAEMREASRLTAGDETVESFARWLPVGRKRIAEAHELQHQATVHLDRTRTILALARSSVRAVESLIEQRKNEQDAAFRRREQVQLDEFSSRRRSV